jgi:hypothetical protein
LPGFCVGAAAAAAAQACAFVHVQACARPGPACGHDLCGPLCVWADAKVCAWAEAYAFAFACVGGNWFWPGWPAN